MHGLILHYDPMTQCGLLRTPAGQVQYFRSDEVVSTGPLRPGQPVALRNGVLVDTGGSRPGSPAMAPPIASPPPQHVPGQKTDSGFAYKWLGVLLALSALVLLLLTGGQSSGFGTPLPKLIDSFFGLIAALLLVIIGVLFVMTNSRRRIRWVFWLTVWASMFAYVGQTFDGFEADSLTNWYGYTLLTLGFAVYLLPYRK